MQILALATMLGLMESETEIPPFDTEDFKKRLTDAGMPEAQAEILAEYQAYLKEMEQKLIIKLVAFLVISVTVLALIIKFV